MAVFSSDTAVPMTIYYPDRRGSIPDSVVRKEVWVYGIEKSEDGLEIEQDHVFRSYAEHRVRLTYERKGGPYYIVLGHGRPKPSATWREFVQVWTQSRESETVVYCPDDNGGGVEPAP